MTSPKVNSVLSAFSQCSLCPKASRKPWSLTRSAELWPLVCRPQSLYRECAGYSCAAWLWVSSRWCSASSAWSALTSAGATKSRTSCFSAEPCSTSVEVSANEIKNGRGGGKDALPSCSPCIQQYVCLQVWLILPPTAYTSTGSPGQPLLPIWRPESWGTTQQSH